MIVDVIISRSVKMMFAFLIIPFFIFGQRKNSDDVVFYDDFLTDSIKWAMDGVSKQLVKTENGYVVLTDIENDYSWLKQEVNVDTTRDFEVSIRTRFLSGNPYMPFGFSWGNEHNYYSFLIANNKSFVITLNKGKKTKYLSRWSESRVIPSDGYSNLTFRKQKKAFIFLIENRKVYSCDSGPLFGKTFTLLGSRNSTIHFDAAQVVYLD